MIWLQLLGSAIVVVIAAIKLAEYGDVISARTRLGGLFVGTLLMAGATSLPELLASLSSLGQNVPNLAGGNVFGSNMLNMLLLGVLDIVAGKTRLLRRAARKHALTASLAILLTLIAVFSLMARLGYRVLWVGWDSIAILAIYIAGLRLIQGESRSAVVDTNRDAVADEDGLPTLTHGLTGFGLAAGVLIVVMPTLVRSSTGIAELLGLTTGFVGTTLVALITSLPELVSGIAAVRLGAYDLAVGNLFGSNMFNIFTLGLVDLAYTQGTFLGALDPGFALVGVMAAILTALALIGNLANIERRFLFVEVDALLVISLYILGVWLSYSLGLGA